MFGKTELRMLRNFREGDSLKDAAKRAEISRGKASIALKNLETLGFVIRERRNKKFFLRRGNAKHASLLFEFLREYPSLPVERLLTQRRITILSVVENDISVIAKIVGVTAQTVYNAIKDFLRYGILIKNNVYMINPHHKTLNNFVYEFQSFLNKMEIERTDKNAILLWEHGPEFLIKTNKIIERENYHLTALSALKKFGLLFIPSYNYYFYSRREMTFSDIIIHTLLTGIDSKTNVAYACLLYQKMKPKDMLKTARIYKMEKMAEKVIKYVNKQQDFDGFLNREEYNELLEEYGVKK